MLQRTFQIAALFCAFTMAYFGTTSFAQGQKFLAGADVSMLPELEKAGRVYQQNGQPGDAIQILRDRGCNLFRVRLFVNPSTDFNPTYGAVQDMNRVRELAKRIKAAGGTFLLDIHYSDYWADGVRQNKPAAWKDLDFDALVQRMHDYTADVLKDIGENGAMPDMVQVGNEIAGGIVWPEGKVLNAPAAEKDVQWKRFAQLVDSGAKAVRQASTEAHPIRVVIHIHGGGKPGLPKWFFDNFNRNPVDYDIIALSFYPAWGDSIDALKQNLAEVAAAYGKDIFIAETSYPWRQMEGIRDQTVMRWPQTPEGQTQFVRDLTAAIRETPGGHGIGFAWWYPEAVPTQGLFVWRDGAEALFDEKGNVLPAADAFKIDGK